MSECVVRMKMPKGCADCGLLSMDEYDSFYKCPLNSYLVWYDKDDIPNYRMNGCPIICQLPEGHGRLVDADYYAKTHAGGEMLKFAETIVPAERSET